MSRLVIDLHSSNVSEGAHLALEKLRPNGAQYGSACDRALIRYHD